MKNFLETICYKIKLKPNTEHKVAEWSKIMNERAEEVIETLQNEGVYVESVFFSKELDGDYIIYYIKAESIDKMREVAKNSELAIDTFHRKFKQDTFESSTLLTKLVDFDRIK